MKGPEAFRTISEAADELGVPQHVLRFWETKFSFIRPMKRAGGRRFYRPQDLTVLRGVRALLHDEGYTIKGVQKLHKEQGLKRVLQAVPGAAEPIAPVLDELDIPPRGAPLDFQPGAAVNGDISVDERVRLQAALDDLVAAKTRLERLLGRA